MDPDVTTERWRGDIHGLYVETRGLGSPERPEPPTRPVVVLLHGLLGSFRNLTRLTQALQDTGFAVLSYDQRGHGQSAWLPTGQAYTLDGLRQDLETILHSFQLHHVHLVGHSMGGRVCMNFAGHNPEKVASLSLLDVGPSLSQGARENLQAVLNPLSLEYRSRLDLEREMGRQPRAMQLFLNSNLTAVPSESGDLSYRWRVDLQGLRNALNDESTFFDQTDLFAHLSMPTLLLRGAQSLHFSRAEALECQKILPSLELHEIPQAGHWIHAEAFEATRDRLIAFLSHHTNLRQK